MPCTSSTAPSSSRRVRSCRSRCGAGARTRPSYGPEDFRRRHRQCEGLDDGNRALRCRSPVQLGYQLRPRSSAASTRGFKELIQQTDELKRAFATFDTGGLKSLSSSLKALKEFALPATALEGLKSVASSINDITKAAVDANKSLAEIAKTASSIPRDTVKTASGESGGGGGGRPTLGKAFDHATNAYFTSQIVSQAASAVVAPAYDLAKSKTQLLANNTPGQADAAIGAAQDLQRSVRGTNVQGNLEVYRQLLALTQNPAEARQLMGSFLPAGVALATFNPDGGDYDQQLESVMKSAEFKGALSKVDPKTGKTTVDAAGAARIGDLLLDMSVVSKGAVAPGHVLEVPPLRWHRGGEHVDGRGPIPHSGHPGSRREASRHRSEGVRAAVLVRQDVECSRGPCCKTWEFCRRTRASIESSGWASSCSSREH